MMYVTLALIIGFILGAIEGRNAVARAQEIAKAADTEAEALKEATAHALAQLHAHIQEGEYSLASNWAHIVAELRSVL